MKGKMFLIAAVIFGLAAALAMMYYLKTLSQQTADPNLTKIVVAKTDIPSRTILAPDLLETIDFPAAHLPPGAVSDQSSIQGLITLSPILKGEPVLKGHLAGMDNHQHGLAFKVKPGQRAISVAVDEVSGVSGMLVPGDRVDVFGTIDLPESGATAIIGVYDVEILAVGRRLTETLPEDGKTPAAENRTATLAVPVEEAQRLILLTDRGKVRLALRSPADRDRPALPNYPMRNL